MPNAPELTSWLDNGRRVVAIPGREKDQWRSLQQPLVSFISPISLFPKTILPVPQLPPSRSLAAPSVGRVKLGFTYGWQPHPEEQH